MLASGETLDHHSSEYLGCLRFKALERLLLGRNRAFFGFYKDSQKDQAEWGSEQHDLDVGVLLHHRGVGLDDI